MEETLTSGVHRKLEEDLLKALALEDHLMDRETYLMELVIEDLWKGDLMEDRWIDPWKEGRWTED